MRHALNALYDGAALLGAVCMVALLGMVLLSIVSRQLHFNVPGTDAYAGYLMAAAGFLALAHTLKRGEHIRVTLVIGALKARWKRGFEVFALLLATALAVLFAVYSSRLAWMSYTLHDISTSADATPLWMPQLSMAAGTLVLAVAFIDELVLELIGARVPQQTAEPLRNE
ncbi:MAG: TRAP transporter small permease [Rhizobacter sp.]|nr:TRAP transporter small permease [Rhizobacter sp.]